MTTFNGPSKETLQELSDRFGYDCSDSDLDIYTVLIPLHPFNPCFSHK